MALRGLFLRQKKFLTVFCERLLNFVGMELKRLVVDMAALAQEDDETGTVCVES